MLAAKAICRCGPQNLVWQLAEGVKMSTGAITLQTVCYKGITDGREFKVYQRLMANVKIEVFAGFLVD